MPINQRNVPIAASEIQNSGGIYALLVIFGEAHDMGHCLMKLNEASEIHETRQIIVNSAW